LRTTRGNLDAARVVDPIPATAACPIRGRTGWTAPSVHVAPEGTRQTRAGLPEVLAAFLQADPGRRAELDPCHHAGMLRAVQDQAADVGVLVSDAIPPELWARPWHRDQLGAVMRAGPPIGRIAFPAHGAFGGASKGRGLRQGRSGASAPGAQAWL